MDAPVGHLAAGDLEVEVQRQQGEVLATRHLHEQTRLVPLPGIRMLELGIQLLTSRQQRDAVGVGTGLGQRRRRRLQPLVVAQIDLDLGPDDRGPAGEIGHPDQAVEVSQLDVQLVRRGLGEEAVVFRAVAGEARLGQDLATDGAASATQALPQPERIMEGDVRHRRQRQPHRLLRQRAGRGQAGVAHVQMAQIGHRQRHIVGNLALNDRAAVDQGEIRRPRPDAELDHQRVLQRPAELVMNGPVSGKPVLLASLQPLRQIDPILLPRPVRAAQSTVAALVLPGIVVLATGGQIRRDPHVLPNLVAQHRGREGQCHRLHGIAGRCRRLPGRQQQLIAVLVVAANAEKAEGGEGVKLQRLALFSAGQLAVRRDQAGPQLQIDRHAFGQGLAGHDVPITPGRAGFRLRRLGRRQDEKLLARQRQQRRAFRGAAAADLAQDGADRLAAGGLETQRLLNRLPGHWQVELQPQHRRAGTAPGADIGLLQPRPLGDELVHDLARQPGPVGGGEASGHRHPVAGRRQQRLVRVQLAGQGANVEPAPVARQRRLDLHGHFVGAPLIRPNGTMGRLNWMTICRPAGTSSPAGVIRCTCTGSAAEAPDATMASRIPSQRNDLRKHIEDSLFLSGQPPRRPAPA